MILVIEDNPADVFLIREALHAAGVVPPHDLEVAADGEAALVSLRGWAQRGGLALVVLDLNLPKAGGIELLQAMRTDPRLAAVPVATWTSSIVPHEAEQLHLLGVRRHFVKPMQLEEYLEIGRAIRALLAESSRGGSMAAAS